MPDEPLIFVEVALVQGMADSVQRLLDEKAPVLDPGAADTAVFYSINNCQRGLDGISFGNFLIKRVVGELSDEFRNIKSFCTLSPIPGYRRWLDKALAAGEIPLTEEDLKALRAAAPLLPPAEPGAAEPDEAAILRGLLDRRPPWRDEATQKALEPILSRLCARYLAKEDAPGRAGRARDPVAHFHLSNGARIERLNWRADTSENGLRQAHGLMVNYLYDPERIEENHELYVGEGKRAVSTPLRRLARG
jgi:malonyl-CoA decarboxylase